MNETVTKISRRGPLAPSQQAAAARSTAVRLLAIPFGMIGQIAVARAGGAPVVADYAIAVSVIGVGGTLAAAGLPNVATRHLAQAPPEDRPRLITWFAQRQGWAAAAVVVAFLLIGRWLMGELGGDDSWRSVAVTAGVTGFAAAITLLAGLARGAGRATLTTVAEMGWTSIAIGTALLVMWQLDLLHNVVDALLVRGVTLAIGLALVWRLLTSRRDGEPTGPWIAPSYQAVIAAAAPMLLIALTIWAQSYLPLWWLGLRGIDDATAKFSAAQRMTAVAAIPASVLLTMSARMLARGVTSAESLRRLRGLVAAATIAAVVWGIAVVLVAAFAMRSVWGLEASRSTPVVLLLAISPIVVTATGPCGYALMMNGHERRSLLGSLIGALATAAVLAAPTITHPAVRAAAAVAIGTVMTNGTSLLLARRALGHWLHADFRAISLADIPMLSTVRRAISSRR